MRIAATIVLLCILFLFFTCGPGEGGNHPVRPAGTDTAKTDTLKNDTLK